MTKITKTGLTVWFACSFFYALEFIVRASGNSLYSDYMLSPYSLFSGQISIFSSAFYWSYVAVQLPAGILLDKYGIKRVMVISTFLFSVGMLVATQATSQESLLIYRVLAGLGGGFAFLSSLKAIAAWLPSRMFPVFTGATQMLMYAAGTLTGLPLVMLASNYSIQVIMAGIFMVSVLLFLCVVFFVKSEEPSNQKYSSSTDDTHNVFADVLIVLKNKQIWLNGLFCFTIYGTTALFADLWSVRFLTLQGYSEHYAGTAASMIFVGIALFSPLWGALATILNKERSLLIFASIAGFFIVTAIVYLQLNPILMCVLCLLWGGMQSVHVLNFTILRTQINPVYIATGLAMVNLFIPLSGAVLQPFVGFTVSLLQGYGFSALNSFRLSLLILPILMFLSVVIAFFIKEDK